VSNSAVNIKLLRLLIPFTAAQVNCSSSLLRQDRMPTKHVYCKSKAVVRASGVTRLDLRRISRGSQDSCTECIKSTLNASRREPVHPVRKCPSTVAQPPETSDGLPCRTASPLRFTLTTHHGRQRSSAVPPSCFFGLFSGTLWATKCRAPSKPQPTTWNERSGIWRHNCSVRMACPTAKTTRIKLTRPNPRPMNHCN